MKLGPLSRVRGVQEEATPKGTLKYGHGPVDTGHRAPVVLLSWSTLSLSGHVVLDNPRSGYEYRSDTGRIRARIYPVYVRAYVYVCICTYVCACVVGILMGREARLGRVAVVTRRSWQLERFFASTIVSLFLGRVAKKRLIISTRMIIPFRELFDGVYGDDLKKYI